MSNPTYEEAITEGHSREENALNTVIKLEPKPQGTGITTDWFDSPRKQSVEWQSCPMQIKQEELHIKDETPNFLAAEDEIVKNTEFSSINAKPFLVKVDLGSKNNPETNTSDCKTMRRANLVSKLKTTNSLHSEHDSFCVDKTCKVGADALKYFKKKPKNVSSGKQFQCGLCEMKFAYKSNLKRHIGLHTDEKQFQCDLCGFKSAHKAALMGHMRIHTGEKPFQCNFCEFKFAHKSALIEHIRIHTGEKPFECVLCEFKSARKSHLQKHMRIHTGEKPFECNLCEFKSAQKSNLKAHMRIHTGEKPFRCNWCESKFAHKSALRDHIRIHTGEKPFECDLCEFKCRHKSQLQKHLRIHEKALECN